jgi:hypothetical protein
MQRRLILVMVLGVAVVACGSSKKTTASVSQTTAAGAGATASTTAPSSSGSSNSRYCQLATSVVANSHAQPSPDPKATFANFDSEASQFLSLAPSAIKADAQTLVDGIRHYEQVLTNANFDYTKLTPADLQSLQDPKFQNAASRVAAYGAQVCGISTGGTSTSAG